MGLNALEAHVRKDMFQLRGVVCKKMPASTGCELEMLILTRISEFFKAGESYFVSSAS